MGSESKAARVLAEQRAIKDVYVTESGDIDPGITNVQVNSSAAAVTVDLPLPALNKHTGPITITLDVAGNALVVNAKNGSGSDVVVSTGLTIDAAGDRITVESNGDEYIVLSSTIA